MRKLITVSFLMFFVHAIVLELIVGGLDEYITKYNGDTDHGIHFMIAFFFTFIFFILSIVLVITEYRMEFDYKNIMLFLVFGNCLLEFYMCCFSQYKLFESPERFDILSILTILIYFIFELFLTFYLVDKMYKFKEIEN